MGFARAGVTVVVLLVAAGAGYYFWRAGNPPMLPPPPAQAPAPAVAGPHYPLSPDTNAPLPRLNDSDPALAQALTSVFGAPSFARFFIPEDIVRHIVATIDNLPREGYAQRLSPVKPVGGLVLTTGKEGSLAIAPANAARYASHVRLLEGVDPGKLVALYVNFYPLFQQAYMDLGYPEGYFNDRLVEVIDHLLATPEAAAPIALTLPHVLHEYADAQIEARSAGQKLLIRMGPENAAPVKAWLRAFRGALVAAAGAKAPR